MTAVDLCIARQNIVELEEQLYATRDSVERHGLFRLLVEELDNFAKTVEFTTTIERHIAKTGERMESQKELVARLKHEGHDTRDAYFLIVTLETLAALFSQHYALARKTMVCVLTRKD